MRKCSPGKGGTGDKGAEPTGIWKVDFMKCRLRYSYLLLSPQGNGCPNGKGSYGLTELSSLCTGLLDSPSRAPLLALSHASVGHLPCLAFFLFVYFQAGEQFKILNHHSIGTDQSEERLATYNWNVGPIYTFLNLSEHQLSPL